MPTLTEAAPSIREIYPSLPLNIGSLLKQAETGRPHHPDNPEMEVTFTQLEQAVAETKFDRWHEANLSGIFETRHPVKNRERLAVQTVQALNLIRSQLVPDAPFLASTYYFTDGFVAGRVGKTRGVVDFKKYPGLSLHLGGIGIKTGRGEFPDFTTDLDAMETVNLVPESHRDERDWHFIQAIPAGTGLVSLGDGLIKKRFAALDPQRTFYAGMALELAGVNPGVRLRPEVADSAGSTLVNAMVDSLTGQDLGLSIARHDRTHHHPKPRVRSLGELTLPETHAYMRIVGLDGDTLTNELNSRLNFMQAGPETTMASLARGTSAEQLVGRFVEKLFRE